MATPQALDSIIATSPDLGTSLADGALLGRAAGDVHLGAVMAILAGSDTKVVVHGGTGAYGAAQVRWMQLAGTDIVGYVSPGRGGQSIDEIPVFDLVSDAVRATGADSSIIYVPAQGVRDAIMENAEAGIRLTVVAAELVPVHDSVWAVSYARSRGLWVVGPNTLGMNSPGKLSLGSIPADFTTPGPVGLMSRSGTMCVMATRMLTKAGCGQSTVVHMGGDTVIGRNPHEYLQLFLDDPATEVIAYVGEIGGTKEYEMLDAIAAGGKPFVALIVGRNAPSGSKMGHAGALIGGAAETAEAKRAALAAAGAVVVDSGLKMAEAIAELLRPGRRGLRHSDASSMTI